MHSGAGWELREDLGCGAKRCRRCLGSLGLSGGVKETKKFLSVIDFFYHRHIFTKFLFCRCDGWSILPILGIV